MKEKIYYGLAIFVFSAIVLAIFVGRSGENEKPVEDELAENTDQTEVIRNPTTKPSEDEGSNDSSANSEEENSNTSKESENEKDAEKSEQEKTAELERLAEEAKKAYGENPSRDKLFSKSELKHTGQITADFLGKFLTFDRANPEGKIRDIIPYGDESVKLSLAKIATAYTEGGNPDLVEMDETIFPLETYKKDLENVKKRNVIAFELQEPTNEQTYDFLDWEAVVTTELEMEDGTKKEVTETYVTSFQYYGKELKVVYYGKKK